MGINRLPPEDEQPQEFSDENLEYGADQSVHFLELSKAFHAQKSTSKNRITDIASLERGKVSTMMLPQQSFPRPTLEIPFSMRLSSNELLNSREYIFGHDPMKDENGETVCEGHYIVWGAVGLINSKEGVVLDVNVGSETLRVRMRDGKEVTLPFTTKVVILPDANMLDKDAGFHMRVIDDEKIIPKLVG